MNCQHQPSEELINKNPRGIFDLDGKPLDSGTLSKLGVGDIIQNISSFVKRSSPTLIVTSIDGNRVYVFGLSILEEIVLVHFGFIVLTEDGNMWFGGGGIGRDSGEAHTKYVNLFLNATKQKLLVQRISSTRESIGSPHSFNLFEQVIEQMEKEPGNYYLELNPVK